MHHEKNVDYEFCTKVVMKNLPSVSTMTFCYKNTIWEICTSDQWGFDLFYWLNIFTYVNFNRFWGLPPDVKINGHDHWTFFFKVGGGKDEEGVIVGGNLFYIFYETGGQKNIFVCFERQEGFFMVGDVKG